MSRDNTPFRAMPQAAVTWSPLGTPSSIEFGDVYYRDGEGLAESEHTFLAGNDLPQRWQTHPRSDFFIAETGFGTGLNFLITWRAWREAPHPKPDLHFVSLEHRPLSAANLERASAQWPQLKTLSAALLAQYPSALPGCHRLLFEDGHVRLDLHWSEADNVLDELASYESAFIDAWYLDGFAPAKNASLWQPSVLQSAAALSQPDATLATFTAASAVRRTLQEAGWATHNVPGFGRKRESLRATAPGSQIGNSPHNQQRPQKKMLTPWDIPRDKLSTPKSAIVVGAGLAGCWAAHALAMRGIAVTVLEQGQIAGAASGNEQGVLYTRVSHKHSALVDFALHAFSFGSRAYRQMFNDSRLVVGKDGTLCGKLQLIDAAAERSDIAQALAGLEDLAQYVDASQASRISGQQIQRSAYWFPDSGWLDPRAVCKALLNSPLITVREYLGRLTLEQTTEGWRVLSETEPNIAEAPCTIIAAGNGSSQMSALDWLPLRAIRGQTTVLNESAETQTLQLVICAEGYIAPARNGQHCIGASFNLDDPYCELRIEDHVNNLDKLGNALPAWRDSLMQLNPETLAGKVGFRCASPDYLPLVGPVPNRDLFLEDYADLVRNAKSLIPRRGRYLPGLYLSTGHGSRGLSSTPMAGELLASMICNEPLPLERELSRAVSPARFIIRDLMRTQLP